MDDNFIWIVMGVGIGILLSLSGIIMELRNNIIRMQLTLDRMSKQIGIPDIVTEEIKSELKDLISEGNKIKAIKKYRMITGFGLKESKEYIDKLSMQEIDKRI